MEILSVEIVASEFQPLSGLEGAGGFEHPFTDPKEICLCLDESRNPRRRSRMFFPHLGLSHKNFVIVCCRKLHGRVHMGGVSAGVGLGYARLLSQRLPKHFKASLPLEYVRY